MHWTSATTPDSRCRRPSLLVTSTADGRTNEHQTESIIKHSYTPQSCRLLICSEHRISYINPIRRLEQASHVSLHV
jgi:hypothetical protein